MRMLQLSSRAALPVLVAVTLASCDSFLDVNENPNAPENARVDIRLPALTAGFIHSMYYGEAQLWGSEWTQQFSYNRDTRSYAEVHRYELQETDATTAWNYFYAGPLNEANALIKDASSDSEIVYRGLGKLFLAWGFAHVADLWGPVPFAEAFDPTIREPKYDDQKVVYEGVHKLLAEAITEMGNTTARRPTASNDLLYSGDMTRWVKLARNLQARHHLRLAYAPAEDKNARAQSALTALAGAFTSNADDADFIYPGGADARNPLYTFQDLQNQLVASEHMVELLRERGDPRIPVYFRPIIYDSVRGTVKYRAAPNTFRGHRNGSATMADSTVSWIGTFFSNENATLSVASYADQKFTEAEARFITSGAAAADAPYRDGIRANMQKLGISTAAINAYLAARPALTATTALEEIITEKYIANYLKVESWNDWRRTGFPRLSVVEQAMLPDIPQRVRTPGSELTNNSNQVRATGIPTGLEGMMTKVWWASTGPR